MAALNSLQQSQIKLLKSILSLSETRTGFIEMQDQQPEIDRQINALEENFKDGLKVIWQMKNPNYATVLIDNLLIPAI